MGMTDFDAADYLRTEEAQAAFLSAAFEEDDEDEIRRALATVARARGMAEVARGAAMSRQGLYKSLSDKGDPKLSTLIGLIRALGMKMVIEPAGGGRDAGAPMG
jgi:probable addiction module antidote protein